MRTTIIILVITVLCGCKKKGNDFVDAKTSLISMWEMRESVGGWSGRVILQPGNGNIVEFKNDLSFVNTNKGNVIRSGTYDLQTTSEKDQYRLTFQTDTDKQTQDITLKGDTLVLIGGCCDIPSVIYVRIHP